MAAVVAITIFAVADLVHDFVTNDPIGFFAAKPHQLLYVAAIAIAGGLAALSFDRLSSRAKRQVQIFAWGAAASTTTFMAVYFACCFFSVSSFVIKTANMGGILIVPLIISGFAAYLWFEFYRALRTGIPR